MKTFGGFGGKALDIRVTFRASKIQETKVLQKKCLTANREWNSLMNQKYKTQK